MEWLHVLILGVMQGITEFLPISSSGHLVLLPKLFGWADQGILIDVVLHLGSLLALVIYFWRDIWRLLKSLWTPAQKDDREMVGAILVGTLPVAIVGFLFESAVATTFRSLVWIGLFMCVVGALFVFADRFPKRARSGSMRWWEGLLIGLAQMVALLPGVSRSGSTTWFGVRLGLSHTEAARFSFLLGMPAIFGAGLKVGLDAWQSGAFESLNLGVVAAGFIGSALASYAAVGTLMVFFRRYTLRPFGGYLIGLGTVILAMQLF